MLYSSTLAQSDSVTTALHQTAATQFMKVNGTAYAYRAFGKKAGMPLIFFQHFTGTIDNWDPKITNCFAKHFHVVLFDNKGIGASEGETFDTIQGMAQDANSFIKALSLKKVNLLVFSMGGFIAQQITLDEPELINKLILAGTGPKTSIGLGDIVKPLNESASINPDEQKLFLFYSSTKTSRALGRESLNRINQRIINRDTDIDKAAITAQLKSMLHWAQPDAEALDKLRQIKQPVLIVTGNNDIMISTINSYTLFNNLPNAKLSLYPDSGHGSIFQYPELFLNEAISFLKSNEIVYKECSEE